MEYLAGIDLGSTSLKCVIYDLAGNIIASATLRVTSTISAVTTATVRQTLSTVAAHQARVSHTVNPAPAITRIAATASRGSQWLTRVWCGMRSKAR